MPNNHNTEDRPRLSTRTYRTARHMEEIISSPTLKQGSKDFIAGKLHELAESAGVDLSHPSLVRAVVIEIARTVSEMPAGAAKEKANRKKRDFYSWVSSARGVSEMNKTEEGRARLASYHQRASSETPARISSEDINPWPELSEEFEKFIDEQGESED